MRRSFIYTLDFGCKGKSYTQNNKRAKKCNLTLTWAHLPFLKGHCTLYEIGIREPSRGPTLNLALQAFLYGSFLITLFLSCVQHFLVVQAHVHDMIVCMVFSDLMLVKVVPIGRFGIFWGPLDPNGDRSVSFLFSMKVKDTWYTWPENHRHLKSDFLGICSDTQRIEAGEAGILLLKYHG